MGVIDDVSRLVPHLLGGRYAELNETASSLCPTQCLSNMPIGPIDWVIHRSRGCLAPLITAAGSTSAACAEKLQPKNKGLLQRHRFR